MPDAGRRRWVFFVFPGAGLALGIALGVIVILVVGAALAARAPGADLRDPAVMNAVMGTFGAGPRTALFAALYFLPPALTLSLTLIGYVIARRRYGAERIETENPADAVEAIIERARRN
jgi:hypothetical protein